MRIRAILFDMDGVLVFAKDWHFEAFNLALVRFGFPALSYADHLAHFDGMSTRGKIALLAKERPEIIQLMQAISSEKQLRTHEIARQRCTPLDAHIDALERLKNKGYRMAVCSNSVRASVDQLLTLTKLISFFEFTLSNEDVTHPKPHPEIYTAAIDRMGLSAAACLALEDHPRGIASAEAAGAFVLKIEKVTDTSYENIARTIMRIESGETCRQTG